MKPSQSTCSNKLLNTLPQSDFDSVINQNCKLIQLSAGEVLYESEMPIHSIVFPIDCIISIIHEDYEGKTTGLALIGNDGVAGSDIVLKDNPSKFRAVVIHPGTAYEMNKSDVMERINASETFRYKLLNHSFNLTNQIAYTGICHKLHKMEQQYCKFLLLCRDWIDGDLMFTQETISHILGVRRETITDVSGKLTKSNIISSSRGRIHIMDHGTLEALACDCYQEIKSILNYKNIIPQKVVPLRPIEMTVRERIIDKVMDASLNY